jgi:hypothetical protein
LYVNYKFLKYEYPVRIIYCIFYHAPVRHRHQAAGIQWCKSNYDTFEIEDKFYGKYLGNKQGFLQLNADGSGIYKYDYTGLSRSCDGELIEIRWGFVLDKNNEIVRAERPYGYSYPIIYNCSGVNAFKNCTERSMVDYILVYKDGSITISSSDDWKKQD